MLQQNRRMLELAGPEVGVLACLCSSWAAAAAASKGLQADDRDEEHKHRMHQDRQRSFQSVPASKTEDAADRIDSCNHQTPEASKASASGEGRNSA